MKDAGKVSDIAARLMVTRRTAEAHVEHIRGKLRLRSRAQIAVWAARRSDRLPVDETA